MGNCWLLSFWSDATHRQQRLNFEFQTILQNIDQFSLFYYLAFATILMVSVSITRKCGSLYRLSCFSLYVWGAWGGGGGCCWGLGI